MSEQGWLCRNSACDEKWVRVGDALICQCRRRGCRRVIAVVNSAAPMFGLRAGAIDALLSTSMLPADDWPGCLD